MDLKTLDKVIKQTIEEVEKGRNNITDIAENAREERDSIQKELARLKEELLETIDEVDRLQEQEKQARVHLMNVSRNFQEYTEEDIRSAYEKAHKLQNELSEKSEREKQLRIRRDQMEVTLRRLNETLEKAEQLVNKVSVALKYLLGNLQGIGNQVEKLQQKQQLGLRIILAQEEERKRVAREIHDGPAQSLANLVLRAEICEKLLEHNPQDLQGELHELKEMVRGSLNEIRQIIFDLRPMVLDDLGIIATLKRYLADFQEKHQITVEFSTPGAQSKRLKGLETAIFRVIQEALSNVVKHAEATHVHVKVEITENVANIVVRDNGKGFEIEEEYDDNSFGLMGMQERVELLEGKMKLDSKPGRGTEIFVQIPIKNE